MFGFRKKKQTPTPDLAAAVTLAEETVARLAEQMFASMAGEFVPDGERFNAAVARMFNRLAENASKELARRGTRHADAFVAISARHAQRVFESRWRELQNAMQPAEGVRNQ